MTKFAQTNSYKAYAQTDAGKGSRDVLKMTVRLKLSKRLLAGLLMPTWEIAKPIHLGKIDEWAFRRVLLAAFLKRERQD
jgi:hypothetical protein